MTEKSLAYRALTMNTLAFTVCFAVWTMYGVLAASLAETQTIPLTKPELGWLLGIPVLTGSILRLPVGLFTDRYGGKPVYITVMLIAAAGLVITSFARNFAELMVAGLVFGMAGTAFAVGIANTSVYFPKEKQGTALGIFGVGNAGSALTTLAAPTILQQLTKNGANPDGWRQLPLIYCAMTLAMVVVYALFTRNRKAEGAASRTMGDMLKPLGNVRVWRFGVYYFLVFGAFVALAQWLVPYYLSVYGMSLAMAGLMASVFSLPSGLIRALGGWASDRFGARSTMYWVLGSCLVLFALVIAPRMDITSPGESVMADRGGVVTAVTPESVTVDKKVYKVLPQPAADLQDAGATRGSSLAEGNLIWPRSSEWQTPAVQVGQKVKRKEVLARGVTHVYFQANVWVFTVIVFLAGIMMGVGKAAVYRHIPDYFPHDVGVVGGIVGVIGGLGGFVCPILFGYLLKSTGLWTSCWMFLALLSLVCLVWMHSVILKMTKAQPATE